MSKRKDENPSQEIQQEELLDLWQRRDHLQAHEWRRLYQVTHHVLSTRRGRFGSLLKNLPEAFDVYVEDFFTRRVFEPTCREGFVARALVHPGALRTYFKRFLQDRLDEVQRQPPRAFSEEEDLDRFECLNSDQIHPNWQQPSQGEEWMLWETGLSTAIVTASAKAFFNRLEPTDRLLFKAHFVERRTLACLREQAPKVYDAAAKLGISINLNRFPDYRTTQIGQWLTQPPDGDPPGLGLSLQLHAFGSEGWDLIFLILQILRACALEE